MHKNDLITQTNDSSNHIALQDLSTEMVELSDEALAQVHGGINLNLSKFIFGERLRFGGGGGSREFIPLQRPHSIDAPGPNDGGSSEVPWGVA